MNATSTRTVVVVRDDDVASLMTDATTSTTKTTTPKRRRNKKKSLENAIQALLPTHLDTSFLKRLFQCFHFVLMAHHDYCAAKELLNRSLLFPQIIFYFQQAAEKMLKALLYLLKPQHYNEYNHNLVWIARNFDELQITVFKRVTSSFEQLGQPSVKTKDKDFRSLAVRCRYPQMTKLPLEIFSYNHATMAKQMTLVMATHVFSILTIVFKTLCSTDSSNSNNSNDEHYIFEYNNERAQLMMNKQTLLFTLGEITFSIEFS